MPKRNKFEKLRRTIIKHLSRESNVGELYKDLFEESHSIMLIINPETGEIIDANFSACKFYQYTKEQIIKMSIMDINTLNPKQISKKMQHAKKEERNYFNFNHKLATGEIRDVEVYSSPIMLAGQKVLYSIIHDITERLRIEKEREVIITKLEKAKKEIKTLKGILPFCSFCKKIRDAKGNWKEVDVYIHNYSEADISHTVCPDCMRNYYPKYSKIEKKKKGGKSTLEP